MELFVVVVDDDDCHFHQVCHSKKDDEKTLVDKKVLVAMNEAATAATNPWAVLTNS